MVCIYFIIQNTKVVGVCVLLQLGEIVQHFPTNKHNVTNFIICIYFVIQNSEVLGVYPKQLALTAEKIVKDKFQNTPETVFTQLSITLFQGSPISIRVHTSY